MTTHLVEQGSEQPSEQTVYNSEQITTVIETVDPDVEHKQTETSSSTQSRVSSKNLFQHPDAHPVVLDLVLLNKYGPEWFFYENELLRHRIEQDFQSASDLNYVKCLAMKTLHMVDSFWQRWEVFLFCCMPLNDMLPDYISMQVPTAAQVAVAVDIANAVRTDVEWSDEMRAYVGAVLQHDHYAVRPSLLQFAELPSKSNMLLDTSVIEHGYHSYIKEGQKPRIHNGNDVQVHQLIQLDAYVGTFRNRALEQKSLVKSVGGAK